MIPTETADTDGTDDQTTDRSRRAFIGATAAVGTLALAGCSGGGDGGDSPDTTTSGSMTTTRTMTTTEETTEETTQETTQEPSNPDVPVLNYALALEHLESNFYAGGLDAFSDEELMNAKVLSKFGEQVRMEVPDYVHAVGDHEAAHVTALTDTIKKLGGKPVGEAEYDFGYETPSDFFEVGMALENTGVAAYAGAAPKVVNNDVLTAAAGIHSVEARHAAFLNLLNGTVPFPKAVDGAKSMQEVLDVAGQFITSSVDASAFETSDSRPQPKRTADDDTSDLDVLNYALTLEHLENNFYAGGRERFSDEELMNADALSKFDDGVRENVPNYIAAVGQHEAAHVTALTDTVKKLGGKPVGEAEYDFGYETPSEFLGVAKALENTGVAAYKGAAPTVSNDAVFSAAIGIHSVEARHASFLNELNTKSPFPKAVDEPKSMKEVKQIAGQFITG